MPIVSLHKGINETEKQLNEDLENGCDWFVDNKPSIQFGEDKTKSILFASKFKIKKVRKLNIRHGDYLQHSYRSNQTAFKVEYLGCIKIPFPRNQRR